MKSFIAVWLSMVMLAGQAVQACTVWSANGDRVEQGGTLVGKNLDLPDRNHSEFRFVKPAHGYKFLGHLVENLSPREWGGVLEKVISPTSGINEKGLVVVCTEVACIRKEEDVKPVARAGLHNLAYTLLTGYASVKEVLEHKDMFAEHAPVFMIFADREDAALLEIAPGGKYALKLGKNGALFHTNHYLEEEFHPFNELHSGICVQRQQRINELMTTPTDPFTFEKFIEISKDEGAGPNNSIWRTGGNSAHIRTLSSFVVKLPREKAPEVYLKTANEGEEVKTRKLTLSPHFWEHHRNGHDFIRSE